MVKTQWFCCEPKLGVFDEYGSEIFTIQAPNMCCWCCNDVPFHIFNGKSQQQVATITKQWTGVVAECFTKADNFSVNCE